MNCPFKSLSGIKDPIQRKAAKKILACAACPTDAFCDSCDCLKCPFFPDELRQRLLTIEFRMVRNAHAREEQAG